MRIESNGAKTRRIAHRVLVQGCGREAIRSARDWEGERFAERADGRFMSLGSRPYVWRHAHSARWEDKEAMTAGG